jgi:hypothetical protein
MSCLRLLPWYCTTKSWSGSGLEFAGQRPSGHLAQLFADMQGPRKAPLDIGPGQVAGRLRQATQQARQKACACPGGANERRCAHGGSARRCRHGKVCLVKCYYISSVCGPRQFHFRIGFEINTKFKAKMRPRNSSVAVRRDRGGAPWVMIFMNRRPGLEPGCRMR